MIAGPLGVKTAGRVRGLSFEFCFDRDRFKWGAFDASEVAKSFAKSPRPRLSFHLSSGVITVESWRCNRTKKTGHTRTWNRFESGFEFRSQVANYPANGGQLINGRFPKFGSNKCALRKQLVYGETSFFSSDVETLEKFQKQFSRRYNGGDKNIRIWKRFELNILYILRGIFMKIQDAFGELILEIMKKDHNKYLILRFRNNNQS